jgi:hypothetical protein
MGSLTFQLQLHPANHTEKSSANIGFSIPVSRRDIMKPANMFSTSFSPLKVSPIMRFGRDKNGMIFCGSASKMIVLVGNRSYHNEGNMNESRLVESAKETKEPGAFEKL